MLSKLHQSYEKLGLPQGSSLEVVKKVHRDLVKKWHPDTYASNQEKRDATEKISEINAAYTYIKSIKNRARPEGKAQTKSPAKTQSTYSSSAKTSHKRSAASSNQNPRTDPKTNASQNRKKEKTYTQNEFVPSKIDQLLSKLTGKRILNHLHKHKRKHQNSSYRIVEKERAAWVKLREKYDDRTRLGLYRSFFNALVFGRIIYFQTASSALSSSFSMRDKYEIDLRHSLINDNLFYIINKGINIFLKYVIGILCLIQFFYFTLLFYGYNRIASVEEYLQIEFAVIILLCILIIPDNLFQRSMLWKYRHLEKQEIQDTFKGRKLPKKMNFLKHILITVKYVCIFGYLFWFYNWIA